MAVDSGGALGALSQHDLLSRAECDAVRVLVLSEREHWTRRSDSGFFTLGPASYLDAPAGLSAYLAAAARDNPILRARFAALFERLKSFFEELLERSVDYHCRFALPGFHVYRLDGSSRAGDEPARRAHFDLQWQHLFTEGRPRTLSFTLPVELPSGGGSMEVWPVTHADVVRLGMSAKGYASKYSSQVIRYFPGRMLVHDGLLLHAIGRSSDDRPTGYRITLQGHGVETPSGWLLYW